MLERAGRKARARRRNRTIAAMVPAILAAAWAPSIPPDADAASPERLAALRKHTLPASTAFQTDPSTNEPPTLVTVPRPDLSRLEETVARQLADARELLLQGTDPAAPVASDGVPADSYGELGNLYHVYELLEPAEACYVNATRLAPDDFRWPYYLGHLYEMAGRVEEAIQHYRRALELRPDRAAAWLRLGNLYLSSNRLDEAAAAFRSAADLRPDSAAVSAALGRLALEGKRYREAIEHLEAALRRQPEANQLHHPLGLAYRGLGDVDRARRHLALAGTVGLRLEDPLLDRLPTLLEGEIARILRGRRAYRARRFADAEREFALAVAAAPDSARARVNLAAALAALDRLDEAKRQVDRALELDPDSAIARYNAARLLVARNQPLAALEHLRRAVELDPDDHLSRVELARTLRYIGDPEAAAGVYREALELDPAAEESWLGLAATLAEAGRYRETLETLEAAHSALPASMRIAHGLARVLAAAPDAGLRDGARALCLARQVFEARGLVEDAELVAMALAELGRCGEAASWQRRALETARRAGDAAQADRVAEPLETYEGGPPCRPVASGLR